MLRSEVSPISPEQREATLALFEAAVLPLTMAVFGGLAKIASDVVTGNVVSWKKSVAGFFISGFVGAVVFLFIADADISDLWKGAIVGMSSFASSLVLDGLTAITMRVLEAVTGQKFQQRWNGVERRRQSRQEVGSDE